MINSREQHVQWAKDRAMQYAQIGNYVDAITSLSTDLLKHEETRNHAAIEMGTMLLMIGDLNSVESVTRFIQGIN